MIFNDCCDMAGSMKKYEKELEENGKKQAQQGEELELKRKECDALIEKSKLEETYLFQLKNVESALDGKIQRYEKEIELSKVYKNELDAVSTEYILKEVGKQPEVRENCECSIF